MEVNIDVCVEKCLCLNYIYKYIIKMSCIYFMMYSYWKDVMYILGKMFKDIVVVLLSLMIIVIFVFGFVDKL